MDRALIENWNRRVHKLDTVYILGDAVWRKDMVAHYMSKLKGKKILIRGNHDTWAKNPQLHPEQYSCFEEVLPMLEFKLNGHPITLCHYPMLEWNMSRLDRGEPRTAISYTVISITRPPPITPHFSGIPTPSTPGWT